MKRSFALYLAVTLIDASADAMLIKELKYNNVNFVVSPGLSEARTDATPDSSTVRATLVDNPARWSWELRFSNYQTGSPNLTSGLDVTTGTDLFVDLYKYPNGHPQGVRMMYIYGFDLRDVNYSDATDTVQLRMRPVQPSISASHAGGFTAIAGIDFRYYGTGTVINYGPPVIVGSGIWHDLGWAEHPSSSQILGAPFRFNGVNGQQVNFDFLLGSRYANYKRYDLNQTRVYIDGMTPASGFGHTAPAAPGYSVNMGSGTETFVVVSAFNLNWSARDVQAGVFLRFTNVTVEPGGIRLTWNPQTTNRYTIEYFSALGGATNILGTNLTGPSVLDPSSLTNPMRFYRLRGQ